MKASRDMGLEKLLAGTSMAVSSMANGNMTIQVTYKCGTPDELGRMEIARELTKTLFYRIRRAKQAIVKVKV